MSYPHSPPPPYGSGETPTDDRLWGAVAHIGSLAAAWFAMGVIGPLVVLMLKGNESPFVRRHAVESLNFQISLLVYLTVAVLVAFFTLGIGLLVIIPLAFVVGIFALTAIIMATLAANRGEEFRYPLCLRFVK
ncbi:MAG: DUF4870 domain-containing protein [Propionibacteriales bacterium]|nr:DUF4870 domain-containing protein [Propionibacteriales bacterium]